MADWFMQIWRTYIVEAYISNRMLIFRCFEALGMLFWLGIHILDEDISGIAKEVVMILFTAACLILGYCNILPMWILVPADIILVIHIPVMIQVIIIVCVCCYNLTKDFIEKIKNISKKC